MSNTMHTSFCVEALQEALARFGTPAVFDQGSQFTGVSFTGILAAGIRISMDGRGHWMDKVFIEQMWRSLHHEGIYRKDNAAGREAHAAIAAWFAFTRRPHQALGHRIPMVI